MSRASVTVTLDGLEDLIASVVDEHVQAALAGHESDRWRALRAVRIGGRLRTDRPIFPVRGGHSRDTETMAGTRRASGL
jgi:hypothetical protein